MHGTKSLFDLWLESKLKLELEWIEIVIGMVISFNVFGSCLGSEMESEWNLNIKEEWGLWFWGLGYSCSFLNS